MAERKGVSGIRLDHRFIHCWESTAIRLDRPRLTADLSFGGRTGTAGPAFARAALHIDEPAHGFLVLPGWTKGLAWLNGVLLGRYWESGLQVTSCAPAPLWRAGANDIVILELRDVGTSLKLRAEPDLGDRAVMA